MSETPGIRRPPVAKALRRIIKLSISLIYFVIYYIWNELCRLAQTDRVGTCAVLYYHSVPSRYRERFEKQMQVASCLAKPVDLLRISDLPADGRTVAITFDDALESFWENAVPVLMRLRIPVTVFAVSDALGSTPKWGESYYSPSERVMSAEQLGNLPDLVTVGSHTLTHMNLVEADPAAAGEEIAASRQRLEMLLRRSVTLFSFPYGFFNVSTVRQCQQAGYERVFTTEPVLVVPSKDQFVIGRIAADPWDWPLEFRLKIMGAYRWQLRLQLVMRSIRGLFFPKKREACGRFPC